MVYIKEGVNQLFLSLDAIKQLGNVSPSFPQVKEFNNISEQGPGVDGGSVLESSQGGSLVLNNRIACDCPKRDLSPPVPKTCPYDPVEENIPHLKQWILEYYKSSAFNVCPHQRLPLVTSSPPMKLHLKGDAQPVAIHKAATVPIHWESQVKEGIQRDVDLGVLEKVKTGEPTTWCSWININAKKDGKPRRVVDLRPLNKQAVRQTHPTEAFYH